MYCPNCGHLNEPRASFCSNCGKPLPASAPSSIQAAAVPSTAASRAAAFYAGFWRRLVAMLLDWLVTLVPSFLLGLVVGFGALVTGTQPDDLKIDALGNLAAIVIYWLYASLMESSSRQATLGKMALGIKVVDTDGARISFGRATGRHFAKWLSSLTLGVGFLMAAFTRRKQALHDIVAHCLVVTKATTPTMLQDQGPTRGLPAPVIVTLAFLGAIVPLGILAAIAIPAYQDFTVRAKIAEVVMLGQSATQALTQYAERHGRLPGDLDSAGFSASSQHVRRIQLQDGNVLLETNFPPIEGKTLAFVASTDKDGVISWKCMSADIPPRYLPMPCR